MTEAEGRRKEGEVFNKNMCPSIAPSNRHERTEDDGRRNIMAEERRKEDVKRGRRQGKA